ncbi:hypothetical protein B0H13DRAFT_2658201 [Mycena leptocephala]|nr:hypothetical protein B0H13DRAFT_2658201 [Mycena leptocephala]
MSQRRMKQVCEKSVPPFTIFIRGISRLSMPLRVSLSTTMHDIYQRLKGLRLVPGTRDDSIYFKAGGRKASWVDTIQSLGLGPLSHIDVRMFIPGGASNEGGSGMASMDEEPTIANGKGKGKATEPNLVPRPTAFSPTTQATGVQLLDDTDVKYSPELQAFVCKMCESCVKAEHLYGHFTNQTGVHKDSFHSDAFSKLGKDPVNGLIAAFRQNHPLRSDAEIKAYRPPTPCAPFSFLIKEVKGSVCALRNPAKPDMPCRYACPQDDTMKKHFRDTHGDSSLFDNPTSHRPANMQRLCQPNTGNTAFFVVDGSLPDNDSATEHAEWRSIFDEKWQDRSFFPQTEADINDPATMTPFLQKTGWVARLEGYSIPKLRALIALPAKGDPLCALKSATRRYLACISREEFENLHFQDRQILAHWKPGSQEFRLLQMDETLNSYALHLRKLLFFAIRAARRPEADIVELRPPVIDRSAWQELREQQTSVGEEAAGEDISDAMKRLEEEYLTDEELLEAEVDEMEEEEEVDEEDVDGPAVKEQVDQRPGYPVRFTDEQKQNALALDAALSSKKPNEVLLPLIHGLLLSLVTEQVSDYKDYRSTTPVEVFLLAINTLPSGNIRPVVNITPDLSRIQYLILFCILKHAMQSGDVTATLKAYKKWFSVDTACVFAAIRYYQHLGWKEVKGQIGVARVFFFRDSPDFTMDGIPSSFLTWIGMVQQRWVEADNLLRQVILMGIPFEDFGFPESELTDRGGADKDDIGFAASRNTSHAVLDFVRIMALFYRQPRFVAQMSDPSSDNRLSRSGALEWLKAVNEFKLMLFFILHLVSGAPKRITEALLHKLFCTPTRRRNVFWILQRLFIIGDYSKTTAGTGKDKKTVHVVPPAMQSSLVVFFMAVIPVEMYLLQEFKLKQGLNAHCYLFAGFGHRMTRATIRKLFEQTTKKYLGRAFGIAQIRQIIPAVINHFRVGSGQDFTASRQVAQMQGHSLGIADSRYANDVEYQGLLTNNEALEVLGFCESYHDLWGFGSRDGLQPVTEVTLEKLAKGEMVAKLTAIGDEVSELRAEMNAKLESVEATVADGLRNILHKLVAVGQTPLDQSACPECRGILPPSTTVREHVMCSHPRYISPADDSNLFLFRSPADLLFWCECGIKFSREKYAQRHIDTRAPDHADLLEAWPRWALDE